MDKIFLDICRRESRLNYAKIRSISEVAIIIQQEDRLGGVHGVHNDDDPCADILDFLRTGGMDVFFLQNMATLKRYAKSMKRDDVTRRYLMESLGEISEEVLSRHDTVQRMRKARREINHVSTDRRVVATTTDPAYTVAIPRKTKMLFFLIFSLLLLSAALVFPATTTTTTSVDASHPYKITTTEADQFLRGPKHLPHHGAHGIFRGQHSVRRVRGAIGETRGASPSVRVHGAVQHAETCYHWPGMGSNRANDGAAPTNMDCRTVVRYMGAENAKQKFCQLRKRADGRRAPR